jgi:hypothetical protein
LASLVVDLLGCRAEVRGVIRASIDYEDLHQRLEKLLQVRVPGLAADVALASEQCLVRDYINQEPAHRAIYESWTSQLQRSMPV